MREALLSRWQGRLEGAIVLELFAGSGVVGIEALGRGAAWCGFVDESQASLRALTRNLDACGIEIGRGAAILERRLPAGLSALPAPWPARYDLIFADPPYAFEELDGLLCGAAGLLAEEGELMLEHAARRQPVTPPTLEHLDSRRYGDTALSRYRARSAG